LRGSGEGWGAGPLLSAVGQPGLQMVPTRTVQFHLPTRVPVINIRDAPNTVFAGYPANPKAGYRISGRKSGKGRIPNIRPDTWLDNYINL
jgi:hypothetical protein